MAARRELTEEIGLVAASLELAVVHKELGRQEYYCRAERVAGEPVLGAEGRAKMTPASGYALAWLDRASLWAADVRPAAIRLLCLAALDASTLRALMAPGGATLRPWAEADFPAVQAL